MTFTRFQQAAPIPEATIRHFEPLVPAGVAQAWRQYGAGFVDDGYFRLVDPARAAAMLGTA
ncbi:MAG: hypothetical protein FWF36_09530, partial [Propionibacteriaceae bacterium]|nr:hypothetical protein [Propionibacteriaceae bacterium]